MLLHVVTRVDGYILLSCNVLYMYVYFGVRVYNFHKRTFQKKTYTNFRKMLGNVPPGNFPGKLFTIFRKMSGKFPTGKFPGKLSGKFREIPGNFPSGKFPGKLSGKIPGKFIFSSTEFTKIQEIV